MKKKLHLISFDAPFPPKYGGVIDVFYKIKALYELNIAIILHIFYQKDLKKENELEKYCLEVHYYKRKNNFISLLSLHPFRIRSRTSKSLVEILKKDNNIPVLYEGLHSCASIDQMNFKTNLFLRAHNIEHNYFFGLAKSERNLLKKLFFYSEAFKLKLFEKKVKNITIFSISELEQEYFSSAYKKSYYIPAFHNEIFTEFFPVRNKKYALWHGDLRISDNIKSVFYLINIYRESSIQLKIASSTLHKGILNEISRISNIEFIDLRRKNIILENLIRDAHINVLYTFQDTGIKLKLLNALYKGKFVLGNDLLVKKTGLASVCKIANSKKEFLEITKELMQSDFSLEDQNIRKKVLKLFSTETSAKKMVSIIFKD